MNGRPESRFSFAIFCWLMAVGALLLFAPPAAGAEIYARKMAVVRAGSEPMTVFQDSVTIIQDRSVLVSRRATMQEGMGIATLSDSVVIVTPEVSVWADSVVYTFPERRAVVMARAPKTVLVRKESLVITAPELEYNTKEDVVKASRGLRITNMANDYFLIGVRGSYDLQKGIGTVDSEPVLQGRSGTTQEPVVVTARRMEWQEVTAEAKAMGDVRVVSGASLLRCDTARFFFQRDSGLAWGEPSVQDSAGEARGDTVVFLVADGTLRQVGIVGKAQGRYRTEAGETVVVQGKGLFLQVADGRIARIEVAELTSGQLVRKGDTR